MRSKLNYGQLYIIPDYFPVCDKLCVLSFIDFHQSNAQESCCDWLLFWKSAACAVPNLLFYVYCFVESC